MGKFINIFLISLGAIYGFLIYLVILLVVAEWLRDISFILFVTWIVFMVCAFAALLCVFLPNDDETERTKKYPQTVKTKIKNIKKKSRLS